MTPSSPNAAVSIAAAMRRRCLVAAGMTAAFVLTVPAAGRAQPSQPAGSGGESVAVSDISNLQGTYVPVAGDCILRHEGVFVVPPLAAGATTITHATGAVVILNQGVRRVISLDGRRPGGVDGGQYLGRARGRVDRDSLVIESSDLPRKTLKALTAQMVGVDTDARLVERLTPVGRDALSYEFTFEERSAYARPFSVRLSLVRVAARGAAATAGCEAIEVDRAPPM